MAPISVAKARKVSKLQFSDSNSSANAADRKTKTAKKTARRKPSRHVDLESSRDQDSEESDNDVFVSKPKSKQGKKSRKAADVVFSSSDESFK